MSIIQQEDELKGMPDNFLAQEMQSPSGQYPQFLVFTELNRRKDMRERFAEQQAQAPTSTMAQEMVAEVSGIGQGMPPQMIPPGMEPPMDMPMQGMPPQMMRDGGVVGYSNGGELRRKYLINSILSRPALIPSNQFTETELIEMPDGQLEAIFKYRSEFSDAGREGKGNVEDSINLVNRRLGIYGGMTDAERKDILSGRPRVPKVRSSDLIENTQNDQQAQEAQEAANSQSFLPFPNQQSTPTFKERIDEVMSAFGPAPEPEYSDLDRFEAMFEELNPAPDPNVTRGRALMAIGQGLLGAPTFAEGLSAGAGGVGQIYGEDAAVQREYNKNRLAAQQALMETRDARAQFDANRDFQTRRSAVSAAAQMYGDDARSIQSLTAAEARAVQEELEDLMSRMATLSPEDQVSAQERVEVLQNRLSSLFGPQVTRTLTATPAS